MTDRLPPLIPHIGHDGGNPSGQIAEYLLVLPPAARSFQRS